MTSITTQDLIDAVRAVTDGRGPDSVIDAVGMEAHGSPAAHAAHKLTALHSERALGTTDAEGRRRPARGVAHGDRDWFVVAGTISVIGVYGGMTDPLPMMKLFDKQVTIRMGQANVRRWVDDIVPLLTDDDPLGVETFATHHVPLSDASDAYRIFQEKRDGAVKIVFRPEQG